MDRITKEQTNSGCSFKFNYKDAMPKDYTKITTHMVFDVKLGTLTRKARLCADGHKVPGLPKESTYSSVPGRDLVRIFFLLGALNGLEVLSADIQNPYLSAPLAPGVKYYIIAKEANGFTADQDGRPCIIVRALYGLPIARTSFRAYLTKRLRQLGYQSCKADLDVHMREEIRKDGTKYWALLIAYVDYILCCGMEP